MRPAAMTRTMTPSMAAAIVACGLTAAAPSVAQTKVEVRTCDDRVHDGRIAAWRLDGDLVLDGPDGATGRIKTIDIDSILIRHDAATGASNATGAASGPAAATQPATARPSSDQSSTTASGAWILAAHGGTRLTGRPRRGDERMISWSHALLGDVRLPLDEVRRITRAEGRSGSFSEANEDVVCLMNGDRLRGAVASFDAGGTVLVDDDGEERRFAWEAVQAIEWGGGREPPDVPPRASGRTNGAGTPQAAIEFDDGDRFAATRLSWGDGWITLARGSWEGRIDLRHVARIEIEGGRRVRLGDLAPSAYRSVPYFTRQWPLQVDRNAMGGPLRVAGRTTARGLGLHSACEIEWSLDGQFERLVAGVGIDDAAGPLADADLIVRVDGREAARFNGLRHGEGPRRIDLDLRGVKTLRLEVGFGRNGDVQDRVNLVNPVLIRI